MTSVQKRSSKKTLKPKLRDKDGPDPVDIHVGSRLRLRRNLLGLSQEQLGRASALTFQQIQKYERGANRISASRLYALGQILSVPVTWFYDQLPDKVAAKHKEKRGSAVDRRAARDTTLAPNDMNAILDRRETTDLLRAWYEITDPSQRRKILNLIKSMGTLEA